MPSNCKKMQRIMFSMLPLHPKTAAAKRIMFVVLGMCLAILRSIQRDCLLSRALF